MAQHRNVIDMRTADHREGGWSRCSPSWSRCAGPAVR